MSERTFNRIVVTVGALLLGYMLLAGPITQRAQQREEEPMPTQGQAAFGTTLYRDGVAVAEIVALHEVGARDAATINLTSHDSAERFGEVIQGLRERRKFAVLGNHLPEQTGTWVADFMDGDTLHGYTIVFPTGERHAFRGFLTQVGTRGEIGGRLYWDAVIVPVPSGEYWHCIGTPDEPGIPPPDDPEHWESATVEDFTTGGAALADGEIVFGYAEIGVQDGGGIDPSGMLISYPSGRPITSYGNMAPGTLGWPSWDNPADLSNVLDITMSVYATCGSNDEAQKLTAYLVNDTALDTHSWRGAIFTDAGVLVAETATAQLTPGQSGWTDLTFASPPTLTKGADYILALWCDDNGIYRHDGTIATFYEPPNGSEWDDEWGGGGEDGYVFCNYVHYALD